MDKDSFQKVNCRWSCFVKINISKIPDNLIQSIEVKKLILNGMSGISLVLDYAFRILVL